MTHATMLTTVAALALSAGAALAEGETIGFSQIGSESGWRAAETSVTKQEAEARGIDLKFADMPRRIERAHRCCFDELGNRLQRKGPSWELLDTDQFSSLAMSTCAVLACAYLLTKLRCCPRAVLFFRVIRHRANVCSSRPCGYQ